MEFNCVNITATAYDIIVTAISKRGGESSELQYVSLESVIKAVLDGTNCLRVSL